MIRLHPQPVKSTNVVVLIGEIKGLYRAVRFGQGPTRLGGYWQSAQIRARASGSNLNGSDRPKVAGFYVVAMLVGI